MSNKTATISLSYFKQGDDLSACIVHNDDGTMNVKKSFENHINLLQVAIDQLQRIIDLIPDDNTCKLQADTHYIGIYGDDAVVQRLVDEELAYIDDFDDEPDMDNHEGNPDDDEPDTDNHESNPDDDESDTDNHEDNPDDDEPDMDNDDTEPLNESHVEWISDWHKTCAEYEQAYIDTFYENPKNKN